MSTLINSLFQTKAFRPCENNTPFWYTSGKIGPYYINTHFLYGNEEKAVSLLALIDEALQDKESCTQKIAEAVMKNYAQDAIFKSTIDTTVAYVKEQIGLANFDYISGGERRDWFFSLPVAILLDIPHVTIFKDMSMVSFQNNQTTTTDLKGKRTLHIADLITVASSYERAWVPAIRNAGGEMPYSLVMVDRMQGGGELLASLHVESHTLVSVDNTLFDAANDLGLLNAEQYLMLQNFFADPTKAMEDFLKATPSFLTNALQSDPKTAARAKLCIDSKFYALED